MTSRGFFVSLVLALCVGATAFAVPATAAPAFSDNFASAPAIDITGGRGTAFPDLAGATRETGEPSVAGSDTDHTIWYRYAPTASGYARVSTCQPNGLNPVPDLSLGVYTGSQVAALATVAQGTNNCPAGFDNAAVGPFPVAAGQFYWIQIGGASTLAAWETDLAVTVDFNTAIPANDDWSNAQTISNTLPQSLSADNGLATVEANEPRSDPYYERQTLWYRWTPAASGLVSINTCGSSAASEADSILTVFTGASPTGFADLSFFDEVDEGCSTSGLSRIYLSVTSGTQYWIKLSNNSLNYGSSYSLDLKWITAPENSALPEISPSGTIKLGNTASFFGGSWIGSPSPSVTSQWRRCDISGGNCVDIAGQTGSDYVTTSNDLNHTLRVRETATNSNGSTIADSPPSGGIHAIPENDDWSNATDLGTGSSINLSSYNTFATTEGVNEPPIGAFSPYMSVWYKWTPAVGGNYVINNCLGSGASTDYLDLLIGVRSGAGPINATTFEASGDNGCGPKHPNRTSMLFFASADTTYWIQVGGKMFSSAGDFDLSIEPVGDPFISAQPTLTGSPEPGGTLTLDIGDWISPTTIVPVINWNRCDATGNNCVDTGNSGTVYSVVAADSGGTVQASITLTNPYGSITTTALSPPIAVDTDGDGVLDSVDVCPTEAGNKPNGCGPSDIVGLGFPVITGNLVTGQTLTSSTGSWRIDHDPLDYTLSYQWQRCDDATVGSCVDISGALGETYDLVSADLGKRMHVVVTATNEDDVETQASAVSAVVDAPPPAPVNDTLPTLSGSTLAGNSLTTTGGTWTPANVTLEYSWLRCDDNVSTGSCTTISDELTASYVLQSADLDKYIRSQVTATNVSDSVVAISDASAVVVGDDDGDGVANSSDSCPGEYGSRANGCPPSDIVPAGIPTVSGLLEVGQTLSSNTGTWTVLHDPIPYTLSYQWQRCDDSGPGSCSDIFGATSDVYLLASLDYAKYIRVIVTATNSDDSATQVSINRGGVGEVAGNVSIPQLSGTPSVGQTLTTSAGVWTPVDATFTYEWLSCTDNVSVGSCTVIAGEIGNSYTIVPADDGTYIRSRVYGESGAGGTSAESAATAEVGTDSDSDGVVDSIDTCPSEFGTKPNGCPPSDIVGLTAPVVSGTMNVGETVSSTDGTWQVLHDPLGVTLSYQWQSCTTTSTASCTDISGATSATYDLTAADYGKRVRINIMATNADDPGELQSSLIMGLISQVPANGILPSVSGSAVEGQTLSGDQGSWTPADVTYANAWLRCTDNASTASCSTISGENGTSYSAAAADVGNYIRFQVTATTTADSTVATSSASGQIAADSDGDGVPDASDTCPSEAGSKSNGCDPSDIVGLTAPVVSGTMNVGETISSTDGTWQVLHDPLGQTLSYQWQRCTTTLAASCTDISGATSATYGLIPADYGKRVRISVTATNADDPGEVQSSLLMGPVSQIPVNGAPPAISGTAVEGQVLSGDQGTWMPADATYANAWLRCTDNASTASCSTIAGTTGTSYTSVAADVDNYIRFQVTATTTAGSTVATSSAYGPIAADSDGDGVPDASDTCPTEAGGKSNGCQPSDIVGLTVPVISGLKNVGVTLSATDGTWQVLHDPLGTNFGYQWQRCADLIPSNCTNISGATSNTYGLTTTDYGKRVRISVTASNADDPGEIQSSAITTVVSQVPINDALPIATGTAVEGQVLSGNQGAWTPTDAQLANAWLRCSDSTSTGSCTTINGQVGGSYTIAPADVGNYIRFSVTATTTADSTVATSAATAIVEADGDGDGVPDASDTCPAEAGGKSNGCQPSDIVGLTVPVVSGTMNVGETVSSTDGTWQVLHDPLGVTLSYQWQSCPDLIPTNCSDISGATSSTYDLTSADYGKRVRIKVTGANADDPGTVQSSSIMSVISEVPSNSVAPSITGIAAVGQTLTAAQGTWSPATPTFSYEWLRCTDDVSVGTCSPISGVIASAYELAAADELAYIRVTVTATTSADSTAVTSSATAKVVLDSDGDGVPDASDICPSEAGSKSNGCDPSDIVGLTAPVVSGTMNVGETVSSTDGTWQVLHDPLGVTLSYQWQRCTTTSTASCTDISGATTSSYDLTAADYGKRVRINITATNADDPGELQSSLIMGLISQVPANGTLPSVSGSAVEGQTLSGDQGSWTPADVTYANAWLRCTDNASTASCSTISGETGTSYSAAAADVGNYIRFQVTATTTADSTVATSSASGQIAADSDGDGVPDASDTCPSEAGSKSNGCDPSDIVGLTAPVVSGTMNVGETISSTDGTWQVLHDPLGQTLSYQWQRCTTTLAASCTDISGATSATYGLIPADYGKRVRISVTATNADDPGEVQSSLITEVVSQVPANSVAPSISGTETVGQVLTASEGTWTPADAQITKAWLRCTDATLGSCSPISSQTGDAYTLVPADDGNYIRLTVTATTAADSLVLTTAPTAMVITDSDGDGVVDASDACPTEAGNKANGCLPSDIVPAGAPTLSGSLYIGQTLSSTAGDWDVLHDQLGATVTYQWQRCNDSNPANCADVAGQTTAEYVLAAPDYGKFMRVNLTATNADDVATQSSAIIGAISDIPVNSAPPIVTGTPSVGQTLNTTTGTWTPADVSPTISWQRCSDATTGSCTAISGATSADYTLVAADADNYIRSKVTLTTAAGSDFVYSAATAMVILDSDGDGVADSSDTCPAEAGARSNGCDPSDIVGNGVPTVSGNLVEGDVLSSTTGTWTVLHDPLGKTVTYQWQRCDDTSAASCADIGGETASDYNVVAADVGKHVRVIATATNADDSDTQTSAISTVIISAGSAPLNNTLPVVAGSATVGQTLNISTSIGDWTPADAAVSFQWLRCADDTEGSCVDVPGATAASYATLDADLGSYMRARSTATANSLSTDAVSAAIGPIVPVPVVAPPPSNTPPPSNNPTPPATTPGKRPPAQIIGSKSLRTIKPSRKGRVRFRRVSVYCSLEATGKCRGKVVVKGKVGKKTITFGKAKFATRRGGGNTVSLRLYKKAMRILRKRSVKAKVTITYNSPGTGMSKFVGTAKFKKRR